MGRYARESSLLSPTAKSLPCNQVQLPKSLKSSWGPCLPHISQGSSALKVVSDVGAIAWWLTRVWVGGDTIESDLVAPAKTKGSLWALAWSLLLRLISPVDLQAMASSSRISFFESNHYPTGACCSVSTPNAMASLHLTLTPPALSRFLAALGSGHPRCSN